MDNNALVPDGLELSAEPIQAVEAEVIRAAQEADEELAALLANRGWVRLAKEMATDIDRFKTGSFIKDVENKGLEEVGKLFVIHQTVASMLQKYLTKVENAAKAVADAERKPS